MNTITLKCALLSLLIGFIVPSTAFSQVTLGSLLEPNEGAILDLKESATLSTKGLGLPRVSIASNSSLEPCLSPTEDAKADQRKAHMGLLVYNTHEVDGTSNALMEKKDMLCKGLHVWNGEKWQPIVPYFDPDVTRSEPRERLTIVRGPGDVEVTEYTTAYFHGYVRVNANGGITTGSVYVCDRSKLKEVDAGQWMTMNLRTKYQPDNSTTTIETYEPIRDRHRIAHYSYPKNPAGLDAREIELNGILYNWAAATNTRDPDLDLDSEWDTGNTRIQGICPDGWHLPDITEWTELMWIFRAQHYLFGNSTNWVTSLTSPQFGGASISPEQGGMDWRKVGARWSQTDTNPNKIEAYGKAGFLWSSTAAETTRDPAHHGNRDNWEGRGYNATNGVIGTVMNSNVISTAKTSYRSRVLMESVRCKKD